MKNKDKTKRRLPTRGLVIASFVNSLLMMFSFCFIYWNATSPTPWKNANCAGASYGRSADGLVTIGEADLSCSHEANGQRTAYETRDIIGKSVGAASTILNLLFLSVLLKRNLRQ